jgi:2-iminobutanoate/2-iminopropanoate deaminase
MSWPVPCPNIGVPLLQSSIVHTSDAPGLPVLSQAVATDQFVLTSGQVGLDPVEGTVPDSFTDEVRQACRNLQEVLRAGECSLADVVRTFCVLTDASQLAEFNDEYVNWFPGNKPARTTIVAGLVGPFRFEIEATALKTKG